MIKAFLKYLLTLCILLLSGYSQVSAQAGQESTIRALKSDYTGVALDGSSQQQHVLPFHCKPHALITAKESEKEWSTLVYEAEDDEFALFKKFLESSKYCAAVLFAFTLAFLLRHFQTSSFSFEHLAYTTSYRWHIILQVFRV